MPTESDTLHGRLRCVAEQAGGRPAVIDVYGVTSFADLEAQAGRIASWLRARGFQPGDRAGLLCINTAAFVSAYFGILRAGGAVVPLNLLQHPREQAFILSDAGARVLLAHPAAAGAVEAIRAQASCVEHALSLVPEVVSGCDASPDAVARPAPLSAEIDSEGRLAAILYTSGTTGRPKGAMLTHDNLLANVDSIRCALELHPDREVFLTVLPMFHAFAATAGMLAPLLNGCAVAALPRFDPAEVAETIRTTGATVFLGVPSMFGSLLNLPEGFDRHLESLRFAVSGGAAMPLAVMERFEARFGKLIYEGDGPTECSPVTCVNPIGGTRKARSVGRPVRNVEMRILDDDGHELSDGEIGEICVKGPNVMRGYWNLPEDTAAAFFGDWFRTGDLGMRDADGYFYIIDRRKDMLIVNGMNVYPRMVEETLYRHPAVREAAVIGEPDARHGETPVAFVALKPGAEADAKTLRAYCAEHHGRYEVPRKVIFMDELPKNAAGKIVKRALTNAGERERGVERGNGESRSSQTGPCA